MRRIAVLLLLICVANAGGREAEAQTGQELAAKLDRLEATVRALLERDAEKDRIISDLQREVQELRSGSRGKLASGLLSGRAQAAGGDFPTPSPAAVAPPSSQASQSSQQAADPTIVDRIPDLYSIEIGDAVVRLKGIDLASVFTVGATTIGNEATVDQLQGGSHDPSGNGFTLQRADLHFRGSVDPYFDANMTISSYIDNTGGGDFSFDEAYLHTKERAGIRVRAGDFFTDFGSFNRLHTDQWIWADTPVVVSRILGRDQMQSLGAEVSWTSGPRSPLHLSFTAQNASGEGMESFLSDSGTFSDRPVGGRSFAERDIDALSEMVYAGRLSKAFDGNGTHLKIGASAAIGPNASGSGQGTYLFGGDLNYSLGFADDDRLLLTAEAMYRGYEVPSGGTLEDWGGYIQGLALFDDTWGVGLRLEGASGSGESSGIYASRADDPYRTDRFRASPIALYRIAPQLSLRLQYNYDDSDHLETSEHSLWGSVSYRFGAGSVDYDQPY